MKRKQPMKQNKPSSNKQISSTTKLPAINNSNQNNNKKVQPIHMQQNLSINTLTYQDEGLLTLIQQYLIKNNLFETLDIFQKDCLKGFKGNTKSLEILKKQLIQAFDKGDRDTFFLKFTQYVPLLMRTKDNKTFKTQFYLQLYFFIYAIHPMLGKKKAIDALAKQHFISYLQGRGATLSKQPEFLAFYALAYIPKPQEHQTFKSMFTKQWIDQFRKEFLVFIQKLYPSTKTPTIVNMYDKFIEYNLETQKFSSVALTEPDQQYEQQIEEQIEQNFQDSIMNNPQPVLFDNNITNNLSIERNSIGGKNQSPHLMNQKDKQQLLELSEKIIELQNEKEGLISYTEILKSKYQNLENDFREFSGSIQNTLMESQLKWFRITQQLYNVAKDLLNASKSLSEGIPLSDTQLLNKRQQKLARYESFVNMNVEDLLSDNVADYSLFERPEHDLSVDMVKRNTDYIDRDQKLMQIDYNKIKLALKTEIRLQMTEEEIKEIQLQKCLILQALRWRITRLKGAFQKREVILSLTINDILGLRQQNSQNSIMKSLLNSSNNYVLFYTTLFISALSKDYYGRQYLFNEQLIKTLMNIRRKPETQEKIKGIILVIFQLQSNKRSCQSVMIDNGLIEEIVDKLHKQRQTMSTFIMEYATALLLNLLLSRKGLDKAEGIKQQILMALINLMETESTSVKSFVHASLYPLLSRRVFREKALAFGMEANIKYLLENSPSVQFEHQLKYVHERLMMENDIEQDKDEEPEFDEINDEQIGEDYEFEIEQINSPLSGQFLLIKRYPLTGPEAIKQMNSIKQQVKVTFSKSIYYERQATDRMSVQTPLLGKGRKSNQGGVTHNNSVYSNKSSNRILRSQKNSRIKNENINNRNIEYTNNRNGERLDTVHQNGSEASLRQYRINSREDVPRREKNNMSEKKNIYFEANDSFERSTANLNNQRNSIEMDKSEETFRQKQQTPLLIKPDSILNNESQAKTLQNVSQQFGQASLPEQDLKKLKPYEQTQQYKFAFQARARLVRTPPQK